MKRLIQFVILFCGIATLSQEKTETFPLESMIAIINNSLDEANSQLETSDFNIETADITLKTAYDKSGGGGFKLFVKASKKWELEKTSTLRFSYKRIDKTNKKKVEFFQKEIFEKNLTDAIVNAADQWQNTTNSIDGLSKNSFSIEISFSVKKITEGGIEFELWGVGVDLGGDSERIAVHTVSLTFK